MRHMLEGSWVMSWNWRKSWLRKRRNLWNFGDSAKIFHACYQGNSSIDSQALHLWVPKFKFPRYRIWVTLDYVSTLGIISYGWGDRSTQNRFVYWWLLLWIRFILREGNSVFVEQLVSKVFCCCKRLKEDKLLAQGNTAPFCTGCWVWQWQFPGWSPFVVGPWPWTEPSLCSSQGILSQIWNT